MTSLRRTGNLRARSKKREVEYRARRTLVRSMLADHPTCQRCNFERSTEVHEILTRARGGSILDRDNCVALCHDCHRFLTEHPRQAEAEGLMRSQYKGGRS